MTKKPRKMSKNMTAIVVRVLHTVKDYMFIEKLAKWTKIMRA
jgi:hypothetical protein